MHCWVCQSPRKGPLKLKKKQNKKMTREHTSDTMQTSPSNGVISTTHVNPPLVKVSRTPDFSRYLLNCSRFDSEAWKTQKKTSEDTKNRPDTSNEIVAV